MLTRLLSALTALTLLVGPAPAQNAPPDTPGHDRCASDGSKRPSDHNRQTPASLSNVLQGFAQKFGKRTKPKPTAPAPKPDAVKVPEPTPASPAAAPTPETAPPVEIPHVAVVLPAPVPVLAAPLDEGPADSAAASGLSGAALAAMLGAAGFSALIVVGLTLMAVQNYRAATPKYRRRRDGDDDTDR